MADRLPTPRAKALDYFRRMAVFKRNRVAALQAVFDAAVDCEFEPHDLAWEVLGAEHGAARYFLARGRGLSHADASALDTEARKQFRDSIPRQLGRQG